MKTKTSPAMTVLMVELNTTLAELKNHVAELPMQLVQEAAKNQLHPVGPQYWIYEWESINLEAPFNLKICLPVATFGNKYRGDGFSLTQLEAFNHVEAIHYGSWDNLKNTYAKLTTGFEEHKLQMGNTCREIYLHCDFENPENNITHVQIGVQ